MIVAAAILFDGKVYALPAPARHHNIIHHMAENVGLPTPIRGDQGFIDSERGFVGRIEARDIALFIDKQIETADHPRDLFSEDLW